MRWNKTAEAGLMRLTIVCCLPCLPLAALTSGALAQPCKGRSDALGSNDASGTYMDQTGCYGSK
jgi:hypothetical protein